MSKKAKKASGSKKGQRPFLGKFEKNKCRVGIVGLPNVGKSSLFNTLSSKTVPAENYPFCTITPSQTIVPVPDKRFTHLCDEFKPMSRVPAVLEVWDIAGLVRGAHEGRGLGNEFLSNIQAVDAIYHVVRAFRAKKIEHVEGSVDPIRDMGIISTELRAKDKAFIAKKWEAVEKLAKRTTDRMIKRELEVVEKIRAVLEEEKDVYYCKWTTEEQSFIRGYPLFTAKPVVFLVNVSLQNWESGTNKWIVPIKKWCAEHYVGANVIPFCARFEAKLQAFESETERAEYFDSLAAASGSEEKKDGGSAVAVAKKVAAPKSIIDKIILSGYKTLSLIHFFTCGADEVKCWTIRVGTKAPAAAGTIHTDMEHGFICAETYAYKDFKKLGTETAVKAAGKYMQNGRTYVVKDGDVLFFKFSPPTAKKKGKAPP